MNVYAASQRRLRTQLTEKIGPSSLPHSERYSQITAFDIAPDGSRLAVLYRSWPSGSGFKLSAAIWDVLSEEVIAHAQLGVHGILAPSTLPIDDEVSFAANKKYLLALALGKVWILDANTCAVIQSISPPRPELGPPVRILKAGRSALAVAYKRINNEFYVALFEVPSGKMIAGWSSPVFPQSFSPNGRLAVGPVAEYNKGRVTNLELVDAQTGAPVKSIPVGFVFRNSRPGGWGSVAARFLDNAHIVVSPDATVDRSGNPSGRSIEVINVIRDRATRKIVPKNFGPTGELTVSPDLSHFAVFSHYVSGWARLSDGMWFDFHKPELLVFTADGTEPQFVIPNLTASGAVAFQKNMVLPKLSNDGSIVAVAQGGVIEVFRATK